MQTVESALHGQEGEEWGVEKGCSCLEPSTLGWSFRVMLSYPGRKVLSTIKLMTSGEGQAEHIFFKPPLTEFSSRRNMMDTHVPTLKMNF